MDESRLSVFDFDCYLDFLKVVAIPKSKYSRKNVTLEKWAEQLGYKSPSSLSMVIRGQRLPSHEMITSIVKNLEMTVYESQYFELLVKLEKFKKANRDISEIIHRLQKLNATYGNRSIKVSHQAFTYVSEWFHLVIRGLVATEGFQEDPVWISKKLKSKITPQQAQNAINTLLDLGLVQRNEKGQLQQTPESISIPPDIASIGIKTFHNDMIERAQESLKENKESAKNVFHGLTLKVSADKLEQAKKYISQAINQFNKEFSSSSPQEPDVYQLNVQFFTHTESEQNTNYQSS